MKKYVPLQTNKIFIRELLIDSCIIDFASAIQAHPFFYKNCYSVDASIDEYIVVEKYLTDAGYSVDRPIKLDFDDLVLKVKTIIRTIKLTKIKERL